MANASGESQLQFMPFTKEIMYNCDGESNGELPGRNPARPRRIGYTQQRVLCDSLLGEILRARRILFAIRRGKIALNDPNNRCRWPV